MSDIIEYIILHAVNFQRCLHMERTYGAKLNMSFAFTDISKFGEGLSAMLSGMQGTGGKGSGYDLTDGESCGAEVKTVSWCQPHKCKQCKSSVPWSFKACKRCGSTNLKNIKDSRFGISAPNHVKYAEYLKRYWLVLIDHDCDDTFKLKVWTIESNDAYFGNYIHMQSLQKSSTCNLLPYSFDFYLSSPTLQFEADILLPEDISVCPSVTIITSDPIKVEKMSVNILESKERKQLNVLPGQEYVEISKALSLDSRTKNHGKKRGQTKRVL